MTIAPRRLFGFGILTLASFALHADDHPRHWLQKMTDTVTTRNYQGVYLHIHNAKVEALKIIHRRDESGDVTERLIRLDGPRREIIRTQDEVTCILPDKGQVIVEAREGGSALGSTLPVYSEGLDRYYEFVTLNNGVVIGYNTRVIAVRPKDQYRYGYQLWLDVETAMPLKSQLKDDNDRVVEQILFAQIEMPAYIAPEEVKPRIPDEFEWFRPDPRKRAYERSGTGYWRATRLPSGFVLSDSKRRVMAGSDNPVEHLVYSDGLASVSVFVEMPGVEQDLKKGLRRYGSSYAYSTTVENHQVTAMGEVPARTVKLIGNSVKRQSVDARR